MPSKLNVADDGTKWSNGPNLKPDSRWLTGPQFLWQPQETWPEQGEGEITRIELRPFNFHIDEVPVRTVDWDRFSKLERLQRSIAYAYRFAENCKLRLSKQPINTSVLNSEELTKAENTVWRLVQEEEFPEDSKILLQVKEGQNVRLRRTSRLYKLSPFIDEHGVIRMDTRISGAVFVPYDTKFPVILPKRHRLTELVVDWYHRLYQHSNNETVVNEIRQ